MRRLTRDGAAEPVSRDQIIRHARGQGNINFHYSADHEQDRQPYPVDPYSALCDDHTYIHAYFGMPLTSCGLVYGCNCSRSLGGGRYLELRNTAGGMRLSNTIRMEPQMNQRGGQIKLKLESFRLRRFGCV